MQQRRRGRRVRRGVAAPRRPPARRATGARPRCPFRAASASCGASRSRLPELGPRDAHGAFDCGVRPMKLSRCQPKCGAAVRVQPRELAPELAVGRVRARAEREDTRAPGTRVPSAAPCAIGCGTRMPAAAERDEPVRFGREARREARLVRLREVPRARPSPRAPPLEWMHPPAAGGRAHDRNGAPVARPIAPSSAARRESDNMAPVRRRRLHRRQAVVGHRQPLDQDRHEGAVEAVPAGVGGVREVVALGS